MKKIEAIIRPGRLEDVHSELQENGYTGITVTEVRGYGRQKGHKEMYRGAEYNLEFVPKIKVEIVTKDEDLDRVIEIILKSSITGKIGDGKIFIQSVDDAIRIRTKESGESAI